MIRMITDALLVLFLALGCASAQSPIGELMATEANISKLDWIFLNAEIESLNIHPSMELGRFYYDPSTDRIVATVRVTPMLAGISQSGHREAGSTERCHNVSGECIHPGPNA